MEDEYVRSYVGRIFEIVARIISYGGSNEEDEVMWKIVKTLTPLFNQIAQLIWLVMPRTKDFTKENFLGRLESLEVEMR